MADNYIDLPTAEFGTLPPGSATSANQVIEIGLLTSIDTTLGEIDAKLGKYPEHFVYSEVSSVPSATITSIASYTAVGASKLKQVAVSGTNIAQYTVTINGTPIDRGYTNFGASLNFEFNYDHGYPLVLGDIVVAKVVHNRPYAGNFNSKIIVEDV